MLAGGVAIKIGIFCQNYTQKTDQSWSVFIKKIIIEEEPTKVGWLMNKEFSEFNITDQLWSVLLNFNFKKNI